jgi:hypothetical protein
VSGARRQRAALAPAGHASVNQPRIAREHRIGPQAQALHHAGTEALDQRVGLARQFERGLHAAGRFHVQGDRAPAAHGHVVPALAVHAQVRRLRAVDHQHVGAHVGQHHAAERAGPDGFEFDDLDTGERAHGCAFARVRGASYSVFPRLASRRFRSGDAPGCAAMRRAARPLRSPRRP